MQSGLTFDIPAP